MSENSEVPNPQESEGTVPAGSDKKEKPLKRNYCYVCHVQCTALKNFLDHQNGKKHLSKVSQAQAAKKCKQKQVKTTKNRSSNKNLKSRESLKPSEQNSKKFDSNGVQNSDDKNMSNSRRLNSKFKGNHYNPNNQNNYSRQHNSKYSNFNHDSNQGYYYNDQSAYKWSSPHYSNAPPVPNNYNDYEYASSSQYYPDPNYNEPYREDEYLMGNMDVNSVPHDYTDEGLHLPYPSAGSENSVVYDFLRNEAAEKKKMESSYGSFKNANKSKAKDKGNFTAISESSNGDLEVNKNKLSTTKTKDTNYVNRSPITSVKSTSNSKDSGKRRLRTKSAESTTKNDRRSKDKNESLTVDSENTPDEQKLKEYTNSLLETNPNRISQMIQHPSSHKEKAVLNHIMTSFSKTKRKENLTRKLRSNSLGSVENNEDAILEIHSTSSENEEVSIISPSEAVCDQSNNDSDQTRCSSRVKKSKNISEECNSDTNLTNVGSVITNSSQMLSSPLSSKKSGNVNDKSKENCILPSKSKMPERRKTKSSGDICSPKRKSYSDDTSNKTKKQKTSSRNLSSPVSRRTEQNDPNKDMSPVANSFDQPSAVQITPVSQNRIAPVKEEVTNYIGMNDVASLTEKSANQVLDPNSQFSVETLIQLFASGNVAVKKEYNDPVIDAIRGVDPNELINACSNDSLLNSLARTTCVAADSNAANPESLTTLPNVSGQGNANCINRVIMGSAVENDIIALDLGHEMPVLAPSPAPTEVAEDPNPSSVCDASDKDSLSEAEKLDLIGKVRSEFPHFITMIDKLQEIASEENAIKESISEAKSKINEYSDLLEEWKKKKKKFHNKEELLRKKRNDIIQLMQTAVNKPSNANSDKSKTDFLPEFYSTPDNSKKGQSVVQADNTEISTASTLSNMSDLQSKIHPNSSDCEEILILPSPVKPEPPEITIVDDIEESATCTQAKRNAVTAGEIIPNFPNQGANLLEIQNLTAHSTVVNCIVVFDDFVYTCSNDSSAKRFSLKDTSDSVTYLHTSKNVTELTVEKVQNEALVFTSCSNRVLSLFIASNGTKIKTFFQSCSIRSICKGWGKFYAGLENGAVNVYNWKYEEKEFVKTENPVSRIATVHQGGLHILIILTTDGHVSLRDAKTSLLIRFIKTYVKFPAWLTVHNDFVYLSSYDRTVSVLDIQSGKIERKWQLGHNHSTGLAVCDDHFFNISYTGIITCVNKENFSEVTLFYGAGKNGTTCIHVYQNWIFTGNRKGDISVFRFNPHLRFACKIAKCRSIFGSKEDLAFHFELQHLRKKNPAFCQWDKCPFIFPVNFSSADKINHLKKHILLLPRGSTMY